MSSSEFSGIRNDTYLIEHLRTIERIQGYFKSFKIQKKNIGYINVWNEGMNELFFMSQSILTRLLQIKVKGRIVSLHEVET